MDYIQTLHYVVDEKTTGFGRLCFVLIDVESRDAIKSINKKKLLLFYR